MCGNPAYTLFPVSGLKLVPGLIETYSHHKPTDQGLIGRRMIKEDSLTAFKEKVQRSCDLVLGLGEEKTLRVLPTIFIFAGGHIAILMHQL